MKRKLVLLLTTLALLCSIQASSPAAVLACSCARPAPEEAFQYSEAVFSGKVIRAQKQKQSAMNGGSYAEWAYTFAVDSVWKGNRDSRITTYFTTDFMTADGWTVTGCVSEGFVEGQSYLVYAGKDRGAGDFYDAQDRLLAGVDYCGRTGLLSDAPEDLRVLGPGTKPEQKSSWPGVWPSGSADPLSWFGYVLLWILELLY